MISHVLKKINNLKEQIKNKFKDLLNQYKEDCALLSVHMIKCPYCKQYAMVKHGYYNRSIKFSLQKYDINILRVKCKNCGRTHAVLPPFIIPYIQTSLFDAIEILKQYDAGTLNLFDNVDYIYLIKIYKNKWKQRLQSLGHTLKDEILAIIMACINNYNRYIFQNHRGKYFYFN